MGEEVEECMDVHVEAEVEVLLEEVAMGARFAKVFSRA